MPAAQCSKSKTGNGLSVLHPYKKTVQLKLTSLCRGISAYHSLHYLYL